MNFHLWKWCKLALSWYSWPNQREGVLMRDVIILQPRWGGVYLKTFLKNDKITDKIFFYNSIQSYFILVFSAWHVSESKVLLQEVSGIVPYSRPLQ